MTLLLLGRFLLLVVLVAVTAATIWAGRKAAE
jgi:hypothetical protein